MDGVGKSLENAVKRYNDFVGSLEGSVLPQARKFGELEVEGTTKSLTKLKYLETDVREARRDRDLIIDMGGKEVSAQSSGDSEGGDTIND